MQLFLLPWLNHIQIIVMYELIAVNETSYEKSDLKNLNRLILSVYSHSFLPKTRGKKKFD